MQLHYMEKQTEAAVPKPVQEQTTKESAAINIKYFKYVRPVGQLTAGIPLLFLAELNLNAPLDDKISMYVAGDTSTNSTRNSRIDSFLKELKEVCKTEYSQENWDGYGARPISELALKDAERFIRMLPEFADLPDMSPMPEGDIALEWYGGNKKVLYITFNGDSTIEYIGEFGEEDKVAGRETFTESIPDSVLHYIKRIVAIAA